MRSMLQYKARSEQLKQEKTSLTVAYEVSHHFRMGVTPLRHVVNMAPPNFCLEDNELQTDWGYCRHFRWNSCPLNMEWRGSLRNCRAISTHVMAWCRMRSNDKVELQGNCRLPGSPTRLGRVKAAELLS